MISPQPAQHSRSYPLLSGQNRRRPRTGYEPPPVRRVRHAKPTFNNLKINLMNIFAVRHPGSARRGGRFKNLNIN